MAKKKNQEPAWVTEFLNEINRLKKLTKDGEIYSGDQSRLDVLKKTGKGNCVAVNKLFKEILAKYSVPNAYRLRIASKDRREKFDHRIMIVVEDMDKFWLQSNEKLIVFRDYIALIKYAAEEMEWFKKGFFIKFCQEVNWC